MAGLGAKNMPCLRVSPKETKALRFNEILIFNQELSLLIRPKMKEIAFDSGIFVSDFSTTLPRYLYAFETGQQ